MGHETQSEFSHAGLDPNQRLLKAEKIRRLVETVKPWKGAQVLDIGTGAGVIAGTLADAVGPNGELHSVDVVDERVSQSGFQFHLIEDTTLPFPDESFDIVLSNHVIEHVGLELDQRRHVREVHRVLRPDGILYMATATRWLLMEPHYHLPFLSWLPRPAAGLYLRATKRGTDYDCFLASHRQLRHFLADAGFAWKEPVVEAMHQMAEIEQPTGLEKALLTAPEPVLKALRPIIPTIIFLARKNGRARRAQA